MDTDFESLERELRGESDEERDGLAPVEAVIADVPEQYADLVKQYSADDSYLDDDEDYDERR